MFDQVRSNLEDVEEWVYDLNINWPKISIVTPSFNQGKYIEETILSIITQNYPNLEYIIIDGGSTDNTLEVIKKYDQYITYWVSEADEGQADAINKGINKCTGEIFNWVNSDDYLQPLSLKKIAHYFLNNDIQVLGGKRRRFYSKNNYIPIHYSHDSLSLRQDTEEAVAYNPFIQLPTFFLLKVIQELNGVNSQFHYIMDAELWIRYLLKYGQNKILLVEDWLANYRLHETSKTVAQQQKFREELNQVYYTLFTQVGVKEDIVQRLTSISASKVDTSYQLENISVAKLQAYVYGKALRWYISILEPNLYFRTLISYLKLQPLSLKTLVYVLRVFIWPRIAVRLSKQQK